MTSSPFQPRRRRVLRALGLRVAVWGGLGLVALVYLADVRRLWTPPATVEPGGEEAEAPGLGDAGWPHLRGPRYDATSDETGLADRWPPEGPPVLWTRPIGAGYSALIAVGSRVYTQGQKLAEQRLVCLDADTGQEIWEYRYGWAYEPGGLYPGPRATPTCHAGRIYFAAPDGLVGCLRAADGRRLWSRNLVEQFAGRGTEFGYACSPLVEEGKVILPVGGAEGSVVALDARDGSTLWASGGDPASYCSALPITFRGRRQVVAFLQNVLASFDLETGRPLWKQNYSSGYDEHAAMPIYREPYLMTMRPFRAGSDLYRIETRPAAAGQGPNIDLVATPIRRSRQMSNDVASSVLVGEHVYGFDLREAQTSRHRPSRGEFKCLELMTGSVCWSTDRVGHATVLAADGKLFLLNDRGELILARATPRQYEELARAEVFPGEVCWTAPTLYRGRLYLRSPTQATCLYVGRPERLDKETLAAARPVSQIARAKPVDLTWLVGGEREFPYDAPDLVELARWYVFSLIGVLAVAGAVAAAVAGGFGLFWRRRPRSAPGRGAAAADPPAAAEPRPATARFGWTLFWTVFWMVALVLGVAGTPLYNRLGSGFVYTWPTSLFVAQQLALMAILDARRRPDCRRSSRRSLAAAILLLGLCLAYYDACRRLTLAITWVFLLGFIPSWPLAIPAARSLLGGSRPAVVFLWTLLAFSLYFWASGGFLLGRAWVMGPPR